MIRLILTVVAAFLFFVAAIVSFGWFGADVHVDQALGYASLGWVVLAVSLLDLPVITKRR